MLEEKLQLSSTSRCSALNSRITYRIRKRPVLRQAAFFVPENCASARFWGMVLDSKQGQARKAVLLHIMNKGGGIHEKNVTHCALHIYRVREEP